MQDWYDGASPKNDDATKVRSVEDISPRKTFVWQHGYSNLSHKLDKAPRLSIRRVIWILASDTVFVQLNQYSQILRRQCCLVGRPMWSPVLRAAEVAGAAPGLQLVDDRAPVAFTSTFTNTVLRSVKTDHLQFFIPIFAFCFLASSIQRT